MAERCGHCGREGTVEWKGQVQVDSHTAKHRVGPYESDVEIQRIAGVGYCGSCEQITLETYAWADEFMEPDDVHAERLYPLDRDLGDLPDRVRDRYAAMLELQHAPDAFAVRAGRLLEAVCADQGVPKSKEHPALDHRLKALVTRAGVPAALTDQALLVKDYRNLGGHDDAWEVEDQDVPLIRKFVESLLDFLYWGPADLARVSAAFVKRESEAHSVELPNAAES
jgi:hypothetical protein